MECGIVFKIEFDFPGEKKSMARVHPRDVNTERHSLGFPSVEGWDGSEIKGTASFANTFNLSERHWMVALCALSVVGL